MILGGFPHHFGVMEGTEDIILKNRIMATTERAFRASLIRNKLKKIGTEQGRESIHDFFTQIMDDLSSNTTTTTPWKDRGCWLGCL